MQMYWQDWPQNIIFDMGNVLMSYDVQKVLDAICPDGESKEIIRRELFDHEDWITRDRGEMTREEFHRSVLKRVPENCQETARRCLKEWTDISPSPNTGMRAVIRLLKQSGRRVYVLSNASDDFNIYFPLFMDPSEFDGILVSYEVHLLKPDPAIFQEALRRWGLKAEDCLFLDDSLPNIRAARSLGMQALHMVNGEIFPDEVTSPPAEGSEAEINEKTT